MIPLFLEMISMEAYLCFSMKEKSLLIRLVPVGLLIKALIPTGSVTMPLSTDESVMCVVQMGFSHSGSTHTIKHRH